MTLFEFDMQRQANEMGQEARQYFVGDAYPPCTKPLSELEPMSLKDLQLDTHHRGKALFVRTADDGVKAAAVRTIVEDESGDVERLAVYNVYSSPEAADLLSDGCIFAIKEPFFEASATGDLSIRVDHPSDLVYLSSSDPRAPKKFQSTPQEGEDSALDWKTRGNQFYKMDKFTDAVRAFSVGLDRCKDQDGSIRCDILRNRAITNIYLKRFETALSDAKAAVIATSDSQDAATSALNAKSEFRAGRAAYELGDFEEASRRFTEASKLQPDDQDTIRQLQRVGERLDEQRTGNYDFTQMGKSVSKKRNRLDHADYLAKTTKKAAGSHGNGLFATQDISAGDLILCEKACATAYDSDPGGHDFTLLDSKSQRQLSGTQGLLLFNIIAKLGHNSTAATRFFELFDDDYPYSTPPAVVDGVVAVDTFRAQAVLAHNTFGCPTTKTSSKAAQRQVQSPSGYPSTGLWLTTSYVNHACNGNAMRSFMGDVMILRATRDISKGEEILMPYRLPNADNAVTQSELEKIWGFKCDCQLCQTEAKAPPSQRRQRSQTVKEAEEVLSSSPISASKQAVKKSMARVERLMEKLEKSYDADTYEKQPRLALVPPGLWLCKAYACHGDWEKVKQSSFSLLRNLGYVTTASGDGKKLSLDRAHCLLVDDAISATILGLWAAEHLQNAAHKDFLDGLARGLYETLNGEMSGFEDKCEALREACAGRK